MTEWLATRTSSGTQFFICCIAVARRAAGLCPMPASMFLRPILYYDESRIKLGLGMHLFALNFLSKLKMQHGRGTLCQATRQRGQLHGYRSVLSSELTCKICKMHSQATEVSKRQRREHLGPRAPRCETSAGTK